MIRHAGRSIRHAVAGIAAIIATCVLSAARAEQLPLWEAGLGATVLDFPHYRGSDERQTWILPLPYLIYRGEFLKADRGSVRGEFYRGERVEVDISVNGAIPVDSEDNSARRGMSNLDPTLEIGPNLTIKLLRSETMRVNLRFPLRAVLATDFSNLRDQGWVFQPQLNVDFHDRFPGPGWNLGFGAGPLFGNQRFHAYYYSVAPQFATPLRPAYEADAGYGGLQFIGTLSKRFANYWVGGFVRAESLSDAVYADSPLVRQKHAVAAGIAFAWVFGRSKTMVETEP